jgi:hypothetical protein
MTKKRKQEVIAELTLSLNVVDVKWNETPENAAWCLGYLESKVKQLIMELESGNK